MDDEYAYLEVNMVSGSKRKAESKDSEGDLNAGLSCQERMHTHTGYPKHTTYQGKKTRYVSARAES